MYIVYLHRTLGMLRFHRTEMPASPYAPIPILIGHGITNPRQWH